MKKSIGVLLVFAAIGLLSSIAYLNNLYAADTDIDFKTILPKKLHRALTGEMNALQNGMTNFAIAIPAGRMKDVAVIAGKMKDGYIIKNVLSTEQIEQLNAYLPPEYQKMNSEFYKIIDKLKLAAEEQDIYEVSLYYYNLTKKCVQCHAKYAKKRFSGFKKLKIKGTEKQ